MRYRGGETSTLSNHVDIEATKNNAIKHFLYVESFRDEQKICLNLVRRGVSISGIMISAPGIMKYQVQAIWNNSSNSHRLGAGGRHGRRHGSVEGRCETTYGSLEKQK